MISKLIFVFNGLVCALILLAIIRIYIDRYKFHQEILDLSNTKTKLTQEFTIINNTALEGNQDAGNKNLADRIIDFGKINDVLSVLRVDIFNVYHKLILAKKYDTLISSVNYSVASFDPKSQKFLSGNSSFIIGGEISDPSGDVEILFRKFDSLNLETKNKFPEYNVSYSSISKNVDFSKKYYSFPIEFSLVSK